MQTMHNFLVQVNANENAIRKLQPAVIIIYNLFNINLSILTNDTTKSKNNYVHMFI